MRLIDADAFIEDMKTSLWDWKSVDGILASTVLRQVMTDIANAPTVDRKPLQPSWLRGTPYCSACGQHLPRIRREKQWAIFCPWCGRKVKLDE